MTVDLSSVSVGSADCGNGEFIGLSLLRIMIVWDELLHCDIREMKGVNDDDTLQ